MLVDEVFVANLRDTLIIYEKLPVPHLHPVARQADDAFDVIGRTVRREFEDDNVTAFRFSEHDPAHDQRQPER